MSSRSIGDWQIPAPDEIPEGYLELAPELIPWLKLVDKVCAEESVPRPAVVFQERAHAEFVAYDDGGAKLNLPEPLWAIEIDPECHADGRYGLIVLHELAHHITYQRYRRAGHPPFMYAKLFQLCLRHGIDLEFAYHNEKEYKPRAAQRGWDLFRRWALEAA